MTTLWFGWWLGQLAGCTPDETGYDDVDTARDLTDDGVAEDDAGSPPDVGALAGQVFYTAAGPLTAEAQEVTFLGLPGTFDATSLVLSVAGRPNSTAFLLADGGFVVSSLAALGDDVNFLDGDRVLASIDLTYDLATLETPAAPTSDGAGGADEGLTAEGAGVQVGSGRIGGVAAPYLAYNVARGAVVRVEAGDTDVVLLAEPGDTVCVAAVDGEGRTSPARCATL